MSLGRRESTRKVSVLMKPHPRGLDTKVAKTSSPGSMTMMRTVAARLLS